MLKKDVILKISLAMIFIFEIVTSDDLHFRTGLVMIFIFEIRKTHYVTRASTVLTPRKAVTIIRSGDLVYLTVGDRDAVHSGPLFAWEFLRQKAESEV